MRNFLTFICFLTNCTGSFTDITLVWRHELCSGCYQYYFQKILKILSKTLKMTNNNLWMIVLLSWTEITDRDGLLRLYFNIELPEPFSREKIPQASIIVRWTWKLRFTSNSVSRSGTVLVRTCVSNKNIMSYVRSYVTYENMYCLIIMMHTNMKFVMSELMLHTKIWCF